VVVRANVSDPFGSYDIAGANVTVYYPNCTELVSDTAMILEQTDPSSPSGWKLFNYSVALSVNAPVGTYMINVTGIEADGVLYELSQTFSVPSNVLIDPDQIRGGAPGTNVTFNHTVTNTGGGRDLYEFTVSSTLGWNVTLYYDLNGDGALDGGDAWMGTDTSGDGSWDSVNSSYDSNSDGSPDTGLLLKGQSFNVIVQIEIPSSTGTVTEVTTTTVASIYSIASDSATATCIVPEYSSLILPPFVVVVCVLITKLSRNKKQKK